MSGEDLAVGIFECANQAMSDEIDCLIGEKRALEAARAACEARIAELEGEVAKLKAQYVEEREAKRYFANHLVDVVTIGRRVAARQPAAFATSKEDADRWAAFYKALNASPVDAMLALPEGTLGQRIVGASERAACEARIAELEEERDEARRCLLANTEELHRADELIGKGVAAERARIVAALRAVSCCVPKQSRVMMRRLASRIEAGTFPARFDERGVFIPGSAPASERAAIVAWLRAEAAAIEREEARKYYGTPKGFEAAALRLRADAIESGAHLTEEKK